LPKTRRIKQKDQPNHGGTKKQNALLKRSELARERGHRISDEEADGKKTPDSEKRGTKEGLSKGQFEKGSSFS